MRLCMYVYGLIDWWMDGWMCVCLCIEINNNKHVYRQSQVRKPTDSGVEWAEFSLIIGTGYWVQAFLAWSSEAQSVCQRVFSLLEIRFQIPWVLILHSAEEDVSPFDYKFACLCQSIWGKYVIHDVWPCHINAYWLICLLIVVGLIPVFWLEGYVSEISSVCGSIARLLLSSRSSVVSLYPSNNGGTTITVNTASILHRRWEWTCINSLRPSDAYMRRFVNHHWFR